MRDTRLAFHELADAVEWLLVREKKRLGEQDCKMLLKKIDLARMLLSDDGEEIINPITIPAEYTDMFLEQRAERKLATSDIKGE